MPTFLGSNLIYREAKYSKAKSQKTIDNHSYARLQHIYKYIPICFYIKKRGVCETLFFFFFLLGAAAIAGAMQLPGTAVPECRFVQAQEPFQKCI